MNDYVVVLKNYLLETRDYWIPQQSNNDSSEEKKKSHNNNNDIFSTMEPLTKLESRLKCIDANNIKNYYNDEDEGLVYDCVDYLKFTNEPFHPDFESQVLLLIFIIILILINM